MLFATDLVKMHLDKQGTNTGIVIWFLWDMELANSIKLHEKQIRNLFCQLHIGDISRKALQNSAYGGVRGQTLKILFPVVNDVKLGLDEIYPPDTSLLIWLLHVSICLPTYLPTLNPLECF